MAVDSLSHQSKLTPEALAFVEEYCGTNLTDAELAEIRDSLYHLGKAIYLYRKLHSTGDNGHE